MHQIRVCKYGYVHGQCRCPSKDKAVIKVECDNTSHAENPRVIVQD